MLEFRLSVLFDVQGVLNRDLLIGPRAVVEGNCRSDGLEIEKMNRVADPLQKIPYRFPVDEW